ncbi:hypothetical protein HOY80DRAFT_998942 [Tuber brumale]|nr:hypothetical protein HOY80DRAFT_998942 [Tuber brumale]
MKIGFNIFTEIGLPGFMATRQGTNLHNNSLPILAIQYICLKWESYFLKQGYKINNKIDKFSPQYQFNQGCNIIHIPTSFQPTLNHQVLVIIRHCIAASENYRKMEITDFFKTQRETIKRMEGFDCNFEAVMADCMILAKVHMDAISESRSGVAVAATDLDQEAVITVEDEGGIDISFKVQGQLSSETGGSSGDDTIELEDEEYGEEREGVAKHKRLAQDQDKDLIHMREVQDEKAGWLYRKKLNSGINKLVGAITIAGQPMGNAGSTGPGIDREMDELKESLTKQEMYLSELAAKQAVTGEKLEEVANLHMEAAMRGEERQ